MCLDGDGDLWVSRMSEDFKTSSMVRIRGRHIIEERKLSPGQRVDFLVDDGYGNLLAGNYNGVFRIPKASSSRRMTPALTTESGLPDNSIRAGFLDREGNLWIGSATQGISRLSDWSTTHFPLRNIESGHRTSVAAADTADHLWIVSEAGLQEFFRGSDRTWHHSLRRMRDQPLSVFCDRQNLLWIAFRDTSITCFSIRYSPDRAAGLDEVCRFVAGRDFPGGYPITVLVDRRGRAWFSMGSRGVVVLDRTKSRPLVRVFGSREGIPLNYIRTMFEDGGGRIWFGSYHDGARCFDLGANRIDTTVQASARNVLPDLGIRSFLQDHRGRVWVGTRAGGLGIFDRGSWQIVSARDGLPSNTIWTMTEDRRARIWLGTAVGVVRVDSTSPLRFQRKRELTGPAVFSSGEFRSGQLWFVSSEGVLMYDPELDRLRPVFPTIQITSFTAEGKSFDPDREITLPYDRNSCTIEFTSPAFTDPESMRYEYRMVPHDAEWNGPLPGTRVMYEVLSPGTYTFEVQAVNGSGIRSFAPSRLSFTILPPLWERWWFIAGAWIVATLILGASVRRWEMRRIERNMQALEQERAVQHERLRIAQDMHDEIGAALSEIAIIGELARQQARIPRTIRRQIDAIAERSREALDSIGEIVWATNPRNDALQNLAAYVRQYSSRYVEAAGLRVRIDIPDELPSARISAEERRNLFLAVKEALHNVVKHAGASEVFLRMTVTEDRLEVLIADDGKGLSDNSPSQFGSGLSGMQRRMSDIGGEFSVAPGPGGRGTSIYLILRIAKTRD
jgi:signal transduction histidine kinase/ligand-binding sensor domain-containing protein